MLQHVAARCRVLQHVAVCCSTLQCVAALLTLRRGRRRIHANMLQHTATRCNTHCGGGGGYVRTCCNSLQHAATCCHTLQHKLRGRRRMSARARVLAHPIRTTRYKCTHTYACTHDVDTHTHTHKCNRHIHTHTYMHTH